MHADGLARCPWPKDDPLYVAYHDDEWGVPEYDDRALFEKLVLDGFQAGLSWITILRKRENFRRAFDDFDAGEDRALHAQEGRAADAGRRHRAQPHEDRGHGAVRARLARRSWRRGRASRSCCGTSCDGKPKINKFRSIGQVPAETAVSRAISKELAARGFKFCGPTIVYAFMQAVGMVNDHLVTCHRHAACAEARGNEDRMPRKPAASSKSRTARAWQRMLSGRRLDLLDPSPLDVEIEDIAHGLARVARWNGQTSGAHIFSVAQHCAAGGDDRAPARRGSTAAPARRSCCTTRRNT